MILAEAIEFSKQFSNYHPKIFKAFVEWRRCDARTDGYVILAALPNEPFSAQLEDYFKNHKLRAEHIKDYWMISTLI
jgi:hypothetical protein